MNRSLWRNAARILSAFLLLLSLASCSLFAPSQTTGAQTTAAQTTAPAVNGGAAFATAEELRAILEAGGEPALSRTSDWLAYWGFPAYSVKTLNLLEFYYRNYFVGELPETATVARRLAEYFAEFMYMIELSDGEAVTDLVMDCYLAAVGDHYAYYMNAETYAEYSSDAAGDFVGIGVRVTYHSLENTMQITAVMPGTPALEAGIAPGDMVYAIDGALVGSLSYYEILDLLQGEEGSTLTVTVLRDGAQLTFTMTRRRLVQTTVEHKMLDSGVGYIRITEFDDTTLGQFKLALEAVAARSSRVIFDLRDNPGGALDSILAILDYMVADRDSLGAKTVLASLLYYDGMTETAYAEDGYAQARGLRIAVLINEYTASAGELFAAALKDYNEKGLLDATVVGKTTYGKGTAQMIYPLPDGRATTISHAYYNPPYSENYEGVGVIPDVFSELSPEAAEKSIYLLTPEEDTQLRDALSALDGR